jgi:hypothetical protein
LAKAYGGGSIVVAAIGLIAAFGVGSWLVLLTTIIGVSFGVVAIRAGSRVLGPLGMSLNALVAAGSLLLLG